MRRLVSVVLALMLCVAASAQKHTDTRTTRLDGMMPRVDLWQPGHMPDSKGLPLQDSIYNNRTWRIITPRLYVYDAGVEGGVRPAVLVIPGGGYAKQAYEAAGDGFAKWLNTLGITAFVLIHRLPNSPDLVDGSIAPTQDAQRAIRYIRAHAEQYGIDPKRVGVIGASSGGHVSACVSTINEDWSAVGDELDKYSFKPDFAILISPVISMEEPIVNRGSRNALLGDRAGDKAMLDKFSMEKHVSPSNPPTFLVHAGDDTAVPPQNSIRMYNALLEAGVPNCSLHIYTYGKHSVGLMNPGSTGTWPETAKKWLEETGILR